MTDALAALEKISTHVTKLETAVSHVRGRFVEPDRVQAIVKSISLNFFVESFYQELDRVKRRAGLVDDIEFVVTALLQLTLARREKSAYLGQIKELRPHLQEAMIAVMKARGSLRLVLSEPERLILSTLAKMLPGSAASYEQVLRDIREGRNRASWRGQGTELREVLREVMDHLAPDDKVMAEDGFRLEGDLKRPTQKQKVRFILKARRSKSAAVAVAEDSLETIEGAIAKLARSTYTMGAVATHTATDASEVRKLKGYVDALLVDLLEVSG